MVNLKENENALIERKPLNRGGNNVFDFLYHGTRVNETCLYSSTTTFLSRVAGSKSSNQLFLPS